MKTFPINVNISSNRVRYNLELNHKVTIITGLSGIGKSYISYLLSAKDKSVKVKISHPKFELRAIDGIVWYESYIGALSISESTNVRYIFIFDDTDVITSKEFADKFIKDKWNLYIIINRFQNISMKSLSAIPFAVDSIFNLQSNGKNHWLESKYTYAKEKDTLYDCVITEDSGNGYRFLKSYNENISSAVGNGSIAGLLKRNHERLQGKRILVFADLASFGSMLEDLIRVCFRYSLNVGLVENYYCFEYLLLKSNMLSSLSNQNGVFEKSVESILKYKSLEEMYEKELERITKGTKYELSHSSKSRMLCYIRNCCVFNDSCDVAIYGNKLERLFYETEWQRLFEIIKRSDLILIK